MGGLPCYTAKETVEFSAEIGLVSKFTPVRSPESNGLAESFIKTFRRDYVKVNERPDAVSVMAVLGGWFEDYNENHPNKGLKMMSPREYIRSMESVDQGTAEPEGRCREWAKVQLVGGSVPEAEQ